MIVNLLAGLMVIGRQDSNGRIITDLPTTETVPIIGEARIDHILSRTQDHGEGFMIMQENIQESIANFMVLIIVMAGK